MTTRTNRLGLFALVFAAAMGSGAVAHADDTADGLGPFVDTDGSIHESDVAALWQADITSGCAEWRFCPHEPVTRGEMAALLARALDLDHPDTTSFSDVGDSRFAADIAAIAAADITHGCGRSRYCPHRAVTRGQMASFISRALDLSRADADAFVDVASSVHEEDIARLAAAGITRGCDEDQYCPRRVVTRAEMATFLARALSLSPPETMPVIPPDVVDAYEEESGDPIWPIGSGAEGWRPLVELFFDADDVDRAIGIMACESKGDPRARNPYSGASGLFQHMPGYWAERSADAGYPGASIFDPEANVAVAAWLVYDYAAGGWHHWVCRG